MIPKDGIGKDSYGVDQAYTYVELVNKIRERKVNIENVGELVKAIGSIASVRPKITKLDIGLTINKLIKRRVFHKDRYDWLKDGNIVELLCGNEEQFLLAYTILENKNVFKI